MTTPALQLPVSVQNFLALHSVEARTRVDGVWRLCHPHHAGEFGSLLPEWSAEKMIGEIEWAIRMVKEQL